MNRLLVITLVGFGLIVGYVRYLEKRNLFYPMKVIEYNPSIYKMPFEEINLKTEDGLAINGWFIPYNNARYTLLFFHGNGGNIGHRVEKYKMLNGLSVNIFAIDYRSYGKSQGKPSEKGLYLDALCAYRYLVDSRRIPAEQVVIYGESLGGAVAIDLASKVKVGGLITEGAFSDEADMAWNVFPGMPAFILGSKFDSLKKIKKVNTVKLFIHSVDDELVPFELGYKLYNAAGEPKRLARLRGGHNNAYFVSKDKYALAISSFLGTLTTP